MGQQAVNQCISCHATWFRSVNPGRSLGRPPEAEDRGIGCERCHGPGLHHVLAAESGFAEMAISLTARTPSRAGLASCVECHAEDGTTKPSDPEFTRFQGTTFPLSRCFLANQDRFSCTTCHDVHAALETDDKRYEAKCLSCHASAPAGGPARPSAAGRRAPSIAPGGKPCPVNSTTQCISCHMPKVEDPSRHAKFTDHHIRAPRRGVKAASDSG
jgi:formate-dependent nitrite reductase cytochrome c552 subunit